MADLSFAQPARRNFTVPIFIAVLLLALAAFLVFRLSPRQTADVSIPRVSIYASHLVFKSDSMVVGNDQTQDTLYALVTVRLTDRLKLPLFLKDFTATLIPSDGSFQPATSAVEQPDLARVYATFPAIQKLAAAQGVPPLVRETRINPGQTVAGFVLIQFPVTEAVWTGRNAATLTIDLYHQQSLSVTIPKQPATPAPAPQPAAKPPAPPAAKRR